MRKRKQQRKPSKAVQDTHPFVMTVHTLFSEHMEAMREIDPQCLADYRVNNKLLELRTGISELIRTIYKELKVELTHGVKLPAPARRSPSGGRRMLLVDRSCQVCGEARAIDICHILPREDGGISDQSNYVYLCPTHHFLFDNARLTERELGRLDLRDKSPDAIRFFEQVHTKRHRMHWRYDTNKFAGCKCGSEDFDYEIVRDSAAVAVTLRCKQCGNRWFNLWHDLHPLTRARFESLQALRSSGAGEAEMAAAEQHMQRALSLYLESRGGPDADSNEARRTDHD